MTATAREELSSARHTPEVDESFDIAAEEASPTGFIAGNPSMLGLPVFIAGTVALALALVGFVPGGLVGGALSIILAATGVGLTIATVWAAALGQSAVAGIFGIFAGFWLSYGFLVLGLTHDWFGVTPEAIVRSQGLFLITWLVVIGALTLGTLRLPFAFTLLFLLIDLAIIALLISTLDASVVWGKIGGYIAFVFAAVGVYLFLGTSDTATGGKGLPLGPPIVRA